MNLETYKKYVKKFDKHLKGNLEEGRLKMLTAKDKKNLPELYSTEKDKNPKVWVKYFGIMRADGWYWLITEYDGKDGMFGAVRSPMTHGRWEHGYISLRELNSLFPQVERDMYFKPTSLSKAKAEIDKRF